MIPKDKCQNRFLYKINSRNLYFGVFRKETGGFIGLRTKFDSIFLFEEYHWDNGPPYGTVKPEEILEELPEEIKLDTSLGTECYNCHKACEYVLFPEGPRLKDYGNGNAVEIRGEWKHTEPSDCTDTIPCDIGNKALKNWLHTIENKYAEIKD